MGKIWECIENSATGESEWQLQHEWTAHQASVWKLAWAHPEFGQILASCSFDRTVIIWEEQDVRALTSTNKPILQNTAMVSNSAFGAHNNDGLILTQAWTPQAQLTDSRESVHDVKFAPRHLGLRLVCINIILQYTHVTLNLVVEGNCFSRWICSHV